MSTQEVAELMAGLDDEALYAMIVWTTNPWRKPYGARTKRCDEEALEHIGKYAGHPLPGVGVETYKQAASDEYFRRLDRNIDRGGAS